MLGTYSDTKGKQRLLLPSRFTISILHLFLGCMRALDIVSNILKFFCSLLSSCTLPYGLLLLQKSSKGCSCDPVWLETEWQRKSWEVSKWFDLNFANCSGIYTRAIYAITSRVTFFNALIPEILFHAARETDALKDAKDKLEKRVEELSWRL